MGNNENIIIGINLTDCYSTGNIMINSLEYAKNKGNFDVLALIPKNINNNVVRTITFATKLNKIKQKKYQLLDHLGFNVYLDGKYNKETTKKLIKIIKKESRGYKNIIIHLHNIHMCNINVVYLYKFLKCKKYHVLYTLHDCWTYTGGCYYYSYEKCTKWNDDCGHCIHGWKYSKSILKQRTKALNKIKNLTLIPCSYWLDNELKQSRLKNIKSIVNPGETSITPFCGNSSLKNDLGLNNKKILITVSSYWNESKGTPFIYKLSDIIPNDYVIMVVGGMFDTKKRNNIIHIKEQNSKNLAEYYSISDLFVSLTQADNLPLVIMEAQICGLPVVGFGHGGTPEEITEKSGIMVGKDNDIKKLLETIVYVVEKKPFNKKDIIESGNRFKKYESAKRQLKIYNHLL